MNINYMLASQIMSIIFGLLFMILLIVWTSTHLGGMSLSGEGEKLTNTHMVLMPLGAIFVTGSSMTLFRSFKGYSTRKIKYIHMSFHFVALLCMVVGLIAIFSARLKQHDVPHFYSLHSWLGLCVILLLIAQHVGAVIFFTILPPAKNLAVRDEYATAHAFLGLFAFITAAVTCNIGLKEKIFFSVLTYAALDQSTLMANFSGLFLALYAATIFYICVNPYFEWERIEE